MANAQAEKKAGEEELGFQDTGCQQPEKWGDAYVMASAGEGRGSVVKFCRDWGDWKSGVNEKYLTESRYL